MRIYTCKLGCKNLLTYVVGKRIIELTGCRAGCKNIDSEPEGCWHGVEKDRKRYNDETGDHG